MRNYLRNIAIGLALAALMAVGFKYALAPLPTEAAAAAVPTPQPEPLINVINRAIDASKPRISQGRRQVLSHMVAQVAEKTFADRGHQEFWVALLGVESRYESTARSSQGAVGLGQLLPQFRDDFGKSCGLVGFDANDVLDDYVNLSLSACYLKSLIDANSGSVPLALVAYNSGLNGSSLKNLKAGANPALEPAAYTAKIWAGRDKAVMKKEGK